MGENIKKKNPRGRLTKENRGSSFSFFFHGNQQQWISIFRIAASSEEWYEYEWDFQADTETLVQRRIKVAVNIISFV
jgi:hypothetical protein